MDKNKINSSLIEEIKKRRTFAIVSHPDAGKSTITEQILLFSNIIRAAGTIKARGSGKHITSDWMQIEKKRGISITGSAMQFNYKCFLINLLDTPGHEDFSEDTYRIITAVDCCLMIIDAAKGVEERTKKLINIARLRNTPIITFINKLDRDSKNPIELFDDVEKKLKISCIPITWPINCGRLFKGVYHLKDGITCIYKKHIMYNLVKTQIVNIPNLYNSLLDKYIGIDEVKTLREDIELINQCCLKFNHTNFLNGAITPVFFGSALNGFGVRHILQALINWGPCPTYRKTNCRIVYPNEDNFSGFIFKIQANMDSKHRDRIAFMRIVSGKYYQGMRLRHVRTGKYFILNDAVVFLARDRFLISNAYPGDIIGIYNHGTIRIGDTFTEGELINFISISNFLPELFRCIRLKNPLKQKQLLKGLTQLSEEGMIQIFRPLLNNNIILGVIGELQFEVVSDRLHQEYKIEAVYEYVNIFTVRWISCIDINIISQFKLNNSSNLAVDCNNNLIYLAPSMVNLNIISARYPEIIFSKKREYH
ncbi:peptide chain release factor 3 [Buchnera aphidicola]|uniref:peptide chain release factor 3 n=1 Tax=Buchnera aphidicola TaxID=9 RepID=UPI0031B82D06